MLIKMLILKQDNNSKVKYQNLQNQIKIKFLI